MALFGLFGKKEEGAEVKKLIAKATQKFGQQESRMAAMERLVAMKTPEALSGLLQRFTVRAEPGITDDEEKQYVYETLVSIGEQSIEPIKAFIKKSEQPTWAIRALEQLVSGEEVVATILDTLDHEGPGYTRDPDKKIMLIRHLEQFEDDRIPQRILPFLSDPSEDVRAATVSIIAAAKQEPTREPLIQALLQAHEESSQRLKRAVAEALVKTGFSVKGQTPAVQAALPEGFTIDKQGVVKSK